MSDFEPSDFSDTNNISDIDDYDDYDECNDSISNQSRQSSKKHFEINMDIDVDIDVDVEENINYSKKILGKLVPKKTDNKIPIIETSQNAKGAKALSIPIEKKKVNVVKKTNSNCSNSNSNSNSNMEKKEGKEAKEDKETKESKDDAKFDFNELTIEFFSRDLDLKKICIKKSPFKNDTALLCLLFKTKVFREYRCNIKKCKTGKTWLGKPIQLLINRKNSRAEDLTIENLELICPNCFIALYGLDLFQKALDKTIYKCKICSFPLNKFSNTNKKEGYCMSCQNKIVNSSYYTKQTEYINELKDTIDDNSTLKQDEFTTSKYYNEVSQFKTFKDSSGKSNSNSKTNTNDKPIINLNMNIPDLDDLINEDVEE